MAKKKKNKELQLMEKLLETQNALIESLQARILELESNRPFLTPVTIPYLQPVQVPYYPQTTSPWITYQIPGGAVGGQINLDGSSGTLRVHNSLGAVHGNATTCEMKYPTTLTSMVRN